MQVERDRLGNARQAILNWTCSHVGIDRLAWGEDVVFEGSSQFCGCASLYVAASINWSGSALVLRIRKYLMSISFVSTTTMNRSFKLYPTINPSRRRTKSQTPMQGPHAGVHFMGGLVS